jgi:hypothetical protein
MRTLVSLTAALWMLSASTARADGAFPDSNQILLPSDKPNEILVGTNFGLLLSEDGGASWQWVCEDVIGACANLYQVSAPPADTILTATASGVVQLTNGGCMQAKATGLIMSSAVTDVFADPTLHTKAFAIAATSTNGYGIYLSLDGGQSFATELYETPPGTFLSGVESARADSQTIYLTQYATADTGKQPTIVRSTTGGMSFQPFDQSASLGDARLSIIAVDRSDPMRLFLRAQYAGSPPMDNLALSEDGGQTSSKTLSIPDGYEMTSFVEMSDGTILVAAIEAGSVTPCGGMSFAGNEPAMGFISTDGGHTFSSWAGAPHARALGERGGVLYAVADNFGDDHFAVGSSTDLGAHWTPLLQFNQIKGPVDCLSAACATSWGTLKTTFGITDTPPPNKSSGCSFAAAHSPGWPWFALALGVLAARLAHRRRRSR